MARNILNGGRENKIRSYTAREKRHMTDGAVSRRWLVLMEPISAVFIACTLGAKVCENILKNVGYAS